jgi:hypothetical protein
MEAGAARTGAEEGVAEGEEMLLEAELGGEARRGHRMLRSDYVHITCFCEAFIDMVAYAQQMRAGVYSDDDNMIALVLV